MGSFKNIILISLGFLLITSCDEGLDPEKENQPNEPEFLLLKDWQYLYILMDGDTIYNFIREGEPSLFIERSTNLQIRVLEYGDDHSYELNTLNRGLLNQYAMGFEENYQPNYGFWDLESDILTHNKTMQYETQYELLELSETTMRRRLIGDRVTYLLLDDGESFDLITIAEWIEVFRVVE